MAEGTGVSSSADATRRTSSTQPGGGTVAFVSPWDHVWSHGLTDGEQPAPPNVLGDIRAGLAIMESVDGCRLASGRLAALRAWRDHPRLELPGRLDAPALPSFSFRVRDGAGGYLYHQFFTRMLPDLYGIQVRGGRACAGSYGHRLPEFDRNASESIVTALEAGLETEKSGLVNLNFSTLTTDAKADFLMETVSRPALEAPLRAVDYVADPAHARFMPRHENPMAPGMTPPLKHPAFRWLYGAQILSLTGVGLLTAALSLAAWRLYGEAGAGMMLGAILALKMVAYVGLAPIAETALARAPRKPALVGLDLARMLLLVPMAFVANPMGLALLTFVFFSAAAAFTPLYQALIPEILTERGTYSRALALSRLAYTLEALLTPILVGTALILIPSNALFLLAALAFGGSVFCLWRTPLAAGVRPEPRGPFWTRALRGLRIYGNTPRLRGLFVMNFALSLGMAWVLVNTVVYGGARFGDADAVYPWLMAGFGVGAAASALLVPRLVELAPERSVMAGGGFLYAALTPLILLAPPLPGLVLLWAGLGAASSLVLTPGGLVLTRSASEENRPAVFAAQFSLSHAGWLLAYPLAGWLGGVMEPALALLILGAACAVTTFAALAIWPAHDPAERMHAHPGLPADHPHLRANPAIGSGRRHSHVFHIDELHPRWGQAEEPT